MVPKPWLIPAVSDARFYPEGGLSPCSSQGVRVSAVFGRRCLWRSLVRRCFVSAVVVALKFLVSCLELLVSVVVVCGYFVLLVFMWWVCEESLCSMKRMRIKILLVLTARNMITVRIFFDVGRFKSCCNPTGNLLTLFHCIVTQFWGNVVSSFSIVKAHR